MKLFCDQSALEYAVNVVNKAISPNNTLPVLNNILLKASNNQLFFASTNLEIAITCSIEASINIEGAITVPAKLLTSYVALLTDQKVELTVEGLDLNIKTSNSKTKIKCINAEDFPLIPKIENGESLLIKTNELNKAINQTVFAASNNNSKAVLSGVLLTSLEGKIRIVATDSFRLAEKTLKIEEKNEKDLNCIIPAKTMMELSKIISKADSKDIKVTISKNQILFEIDGIELISRLIEGKFPDYQKILPKGEKTLITVSLSELVLVLKRVSLFAKENNNSIKLEILNEGKIIVRSNETKIGEEQAEITVKVTGENNSISLNSQYLLDVLNCIDDEKVYITINDINAPALIKPVKEEEYVYIIMPLKI